MIKNISKYPYVEIEWYDIEDSSEWSSLESLSKEQLPVAVSKGYLLDQKNGVTRLFRDYIRTKDKNKDTFEDIGSTVIIPSCVIISMKKIKL
tara:strand:+ start:29 stop:304 length:276 start_codon:yes stop_codon:yes gene_type:complete